VSQIPCTPAPIVVGISRAHYTVVMPAADTNATSDYRSSNKSDDDVIEGQPPRFSVNSGNREDSGQRERSGKAEGSGNVDVVI
jgi:hypothetical protein